jgi:hypothetical protein
MARAETCSARIEAIHDHISDCLLVTRICPRIATETKFIIAKVGFMSVLRCGLINQISIAKMRLKDGRGCEMLTSWYHSELKFAWFDGTPRTKPLRQP